jgi:methylenetetrahydrofolate reductase (NADPH)
MKKAKNPELEGKTIALELIGDIRKNKGFHGLHITALFWENIIPDLVKEANLLNKNQDS